MPKRLSKGDFSHRVQKAREKFHYSGKTVKDWAIENGVSPANVYEVLKGIRPCHRGDSHKIAVLLGIKDGVIED